MSDSRPVSELFADALNQFSRLVRSEIQLARAELTEKAKQGVAGGGLLLGAAVLLIPSVVLLLMALASLLVELGARASPANLVAGGVGLLIVAALGWAGLNRLSAQSFIPDRAVAQLQRDAAAAKEHV